jgi:hypothetical protein
LENVKIKGSKISVGLGSNENISLNNSMSQTSLKKSSDNVLGSSIRGPAPPPPNRNRYYKALYDYKPAKDDELNIVIDDILEVSTNEEGGWFYGKKVNFTESSDRIKEGWAPANYFEPCESPQPSKVEHRGPPPSIKAEPTKPVASVSHFNNSSGVAKHSRPDGSQESLNAVNKYAKVSKSIENIGNAPTAKPVFPLKSQPFNVGNTPNVPTAKPVIPSMSQPSSIPKSKSAEMGRSALYKTSPTTTRANEQMPLNKTTNVNYGLKKSEEIKRNPSNPELNSALNKILGQGVRQPGGGIPCFENPKDIGKSPPLPPKPKF